MENNEADEIESTISTLEDRYRQIYREINAYINEDEISSKSIDGVPIRKLFIGNLAERATSKDVQNLFSVYGKVESCYLYRNEKKRNCAFVTFMNVDSASSAWRDGYCKQIRLHNRDLIVMAADLWNQPDSIEQKLRERWLHLELNSTHRYALNIKDTPIHMLNDDCLIYIFNFLSVNDRIRSERVCKHWRVLSLKSWHTVKKLDLSYSTWGQQIRPINTAMLRRVLLRCGKFITHIHLSDVPNDLSINTLPIIAYFCPNLTCIDGSSLPICPMDLHTLTKKCKKITYLSIGSVADISDNDLKNVFKEYEDLSYFEARGNDNIFGTCLSYLPAQMLRTLVIKECHKITDANLSTALARLKNLECLKLLNCCHIGEKIMEAISDHCKSLTDLRICGRAGWLYNMNIQFTNLVNLRRLEITHFFALSNEQLINVALNCPQITHLDISGCDKVTDTGIIAIAGLSKLEYLYINFLTNITNHSLKNLVNLKIFECHSCPLITDHGVCKILVSSPQLQLLDLSQCCNITNATYEVAKRICDSRTNNVILKMFIQGTQIVLTDAVSPFLQTVNFIRPEPFVRMPYTGW
ncbi:putative RNA-binding protein EEED8.10 [Harpegnathos saltator]|uniref:putative RNA-binding protein EEED8.10 n=1 Tax=Harpegnathos saltator TaxID=610380 RepID=UPI00058F27D5|nr:putative RNA-binding protein EEED8.10 [Harpegnathos saltator]XP_025161288.1 putative RNA-binding protein EEED8.10 [Harpegnathos saltator]